MKDSWDIVSELAWPRSAFEDEHTFLCTLSFLKISVASSKCWFSKILKRVSSVREAGGL